MTDQSPALDQRLAGVFGVLKANLARDQALVIIKVTDGKRSRPDHFEVAYYANPVQLVLAADELLRKAATLFALDHEGGSKLTDQQLALVVAARRALQVDCMPSPTAAPLSP
jgi:hypothetical protein